MEPNSSKENVSRDPRATSFANKSTLQQAAPENRPIAQNCTFVRVRACQHVCTDKTDRPLRSINILVSPLLLNDRKRTILTISLSGDETSSMRSFTYIQASINFLSTFSLDENKQTNKTAASLVNIVEENQTPANIWKTCDVRKLACLNPLINPKSI